MKRDRLTYIKNILFPCVVFSAVAGGLTGGMIFLFRKAASLVGEWSAEVYHYAAGHPYTIPLVIFGAAALGVISWLFWKFIPDSRGGGIPSSIGLLRGILTFRWLRCLFGVVFSSMVTYLAGIPLGTEGPSVQIGTALGRGTVRILGRNHPAWDRYAMTGGASAGFAAATGSPLTGILFAFEEAHGRFSPMIFMVSSMTAVAGSLTTKFLFQISGSDWRMFSFSADAALPLSGYWMPLAVGAVCGLFAVVFTKLYDLAGEFLGKLRKIPPLVLTVGIFAVVAAAGVISPAVTGSGHHLIEELAEKAGMSWWILLLLLCFRSLFLILANRIGVTGGLFVPSLAFGAILGALCGQIFVSLGILPQAYYPIAVIVGMTSFLGASSRTPLMAVAFGLEALGGMENCVAIGLGVAFAYVVIEFFGMEGFVDTVLSRKISEARAGKAFETTEKEFTVRPGSFVIGKEIRDILWPPSCLVLSVDRNPAAARGGEEISEGDILHLHYASSDPAETEKTLEDLVGKQ